MFRRIYLDNSSTTRVDPVVVEAMLPFLTEDFGNASSIHFYGQRARGAVDKARHQVAGLINSRPNEVIFTSGGTESNNLAIRGLIEAFVSGQQGNKGDSIPHIITSAIEHSAVKSVCEDLEKQGIEVTYLPVYKNGIVRVEDVINAIREETILISIMTANNEIGTLQPVEEIGRRIRELKQSGKKIWFHTDAVQAAGKIEIDVESIGCDLLSLSGHKIHAPKGVGALYVRRGTRLHSQNIGGRQERGLRGGTESVPNIVALGKAAELGKENLADESARLMTLRQKLENEIGEKISDLVFNGERESRLPNIANISFLGVEGEGLLINLDMQGIAVSTGSACSSGSLEPSAVIRALGHGDDVARNAIRFSLGRFNTADDIARLLEVLPNAVETLRKLSPRSQTTSN
ncbi:MAG: cysteine desulfurase [Pyrinomonadaceae bacterium]|nr:cysteine desulfurase [Acidobacteriota bacterium]MBK7934052.1 cysteine desulfurase [Acidobacteriota bacterium]MBP7376167.1 cysteine desulfurase [Pyrinomonadaceae bacterium]